MPTRMEQTLTFSGNGNGWDNEILTKAANVTRGGNIREILLRQGVGGGATAVDIYGVHSNSDLAAAPADDIVFYKRTGHVPTASATLASLVDTLPVTGGQFRPNVAKRWALNVTAAGAWSITLVVRYEMAD